MQPREFFLRVTEAHGRASERVDPQRLSLDLAGRRVTIDSASSILAERLYRALVHRKVATDSGPNTLNILAWDTKSSGVPAPAPPWGPHDYGDRGLIRGFNRDGIRTAFHAGVNVLSIFDEETGTAAYWTPDAVALPDYQVGSPFLIIFHWWAEAEGLLLVHSGAVGNERGGVLLAGAGGTGKSTTALSCISSPSLMYASDDYCLLDSASGDRAHSLFNTGKLDARSLDLLPHLRPMVAASGVAYDEKSIIFLAEQLPERLIGSVPVKAILLPRPCGLPTTRFRRASRAEALLALAPSTIFQLTGAGAHQLAELGKLVRRLPCYHLDLGIDTTSTADVISSIMRDLE